MRVQRTRGIYQRRETRLFCNTLYSHRGRRRVPLDRKFSQHARITARLGQIVRSDYTIVLVRTRCRFRVLNELYNIASAADS